MRLKVKELAEILIKSLTPRVDYRSVALEVNLKLERFGGVCNRTPSKVFDRPQYGSSSVMFNLVRRRAGLWRSTGAPGGRMLNRFGTGPANPLPYGVKVL